MSTRPGPPLERLLRRLLDTPGAFLAPPRLVRGQAVSGQLHLDALVADTLRRLGGRPLTRAASAPLRAAPEPARVNALSLIALACWLLHDPGFSAQPGLAEPARDLLLSGFDDLASVVPAAACVSDPDRREELARRMLLALGLHPAGESPAEARDRLTALDSLERLAVTRAALKAERRARAIRERAARAAAEAANYYGRE
jgi:hypothetical protein